MNKRLQTILEIEHITASQLADALGIQRGGVSHLLSGRNKPSFDFLERLLRKYPNISAEWLITGKGKPIREESQHSPSNTSFNSSNSIFHQPNIQSNIFENSLFDTPSEQRMPESDIQRETPAPATQHDPAAPSPSRPRKPVRIIVYFSDGTYTEFYPFSVPSPSE